MSREQKRETALLLGTAVLMGAAWLAPVTGWGKALCWLVPLVIAGFPVWKEAAKGIAHAEAFDENFLMTIAALGAFALGEYGEAVFVLLLFRVGELLEHLAQHRSRNAVRALLHLRPDTARVLRHSGVMVPPDTVAVGERISVLPGERVPLDGKVVEGVTELDTAALTGEAQPRRASPGDAVLSGCVNLRAPITVEVTKAYGESAVARILSMVEAAPGSSRKESFLSRFAKWYTPAVVAGAVLLALVPSVFTGQWSVWIPRALTFLVASCPCALVVSVPLTYFCAIGGASRRGILVKDSGHLEALTAVRSIAFDKTGTLTMSGQPDRVREDAAATLSALAAMGVRDRILLSGDRRQAVEAVAKALPLTAYHGELLPEDKVRLLHELPGATAFVGDGVNDAPVLAHADVGIAMGAFGSDGAMEAADVVLLEDDLRGLPRVFALARRTGRIVRENLIFSIGVKMTILLLGALGVAGLGWAVFADVGVLVLATLNGMRMLRLTK